MCRYPFGSGGKRVCTRPPCLPALVSWMMMSRMKLDRPPASVEDSAGDSTGAAPALDSNKFICLYDLPYEHIEAEWPIGHIQADMVPHQYHIGITIAPMNLERYICPPFAEPQQCINLPFLCDLCAFARNCP